MLYFLGKIKLKAPPGWFDFGKKTYSHIAGSLKKKVGATVIQLDLFPTLWALVKSVNPCPSPSAPENMNHRSIPVTGRASSW